MITAENARLLTRDGQQATKAERRAGIERKIREAAGHPVHPSSWTLSPYRLLVEEIIWLESLGYRVRDGGIISWE